MKHAGHILKILGDLRFFAGFLLAAARERQTTASASGIPSGRVLGFQREIRYKENRKRTESQTPMPHSDLAI
jgi:hypothetical protein